METKENKCGRPKKEAEKLTKSINLKLNESDFGMIQQKAASLGMTPTQYVRQMALNGEIKSRFTQEELGLMRNLYGMGNNLNQVTKRANSDGMYRVRDLAIEALSEIKALFNDSEKHKR